MKYITTAFSPNMLKSENLTGDDLKFMGKEISLSEFVKLAAGAVSCIGHQTTADILSGLSGMKLEFNRINISLDRDDILAVAIPQFRADQSREFSQQEIEKAEFRFFKIEIV